jgi:hypothetical protein
MQPSANLHRINKACQRQFVMTGLGFLPVSGIMGQVALSGRTAHSSAWLQVPTCSRAISAPAALRAAGGIFGFGRRGTHCLYRGSCVVRVYELEVARQPIYDVEWRASWHSSGGWCTPSRLLPRQIHL